MSCVAVTGGDNRNSDDRCGSPEFGFHRAIAPPQRPGDSRQKYRAMGLRNSLCHSRHRGFAQTMGAKQRVPRLPECRHPRTTAHYTIIKGACTHEETRRLRNYHRRRWQRWLPGAVSPRIQSRLRGYACSKLWARTLTTPFTRDLETRHCGDGLRPLTRCEICGHPEGARADLLIIRDGR